MIATILLAIPGFVLLWVFITYVEHLISLKKYPKGPFPLPLIGNVLLLGKKTYLDFAELTKCYGDVFSFSFGKFHFKTFHQKSCHGKCKTSICDTLSGC